MPNLDCLNISIKKCLNYLFRHFDQQNKCAINHYLLKYDSVILFGVLSILFLIIVKTKLLLPQQLKQ